MKLVSVSVNGQEQLGIRLAEGVLPVSVLSGIRHGAHELPRTIHELINSEGMADRLQKALQAQIHDLSTRLLQEDQMTYLPCVPRPGKIICIGRNYREHALETNSEIPTSPIVFSKFSDTVAAFGEDIHLPAGSKQVDYEAELAIVIGRRAVRVSREDALEYVFGYCNANDLSARDLQFRTNQWLLGKTCAQFAPIGPYVVTADEVGDPQNLTIKTFVNGELRQNAHTGDMMFPCAELIHYLSHYITLEPGDLVFTGTPEGVIFGMPEENRKWLQAGDVVTVEVEKLGTLTNRMVSPL